MKKNKKEQRETKESHPRETAKSIGTSSGTTSFTRETSAPSGPPPFCRTEEGLATGDTQPGDNYEPTTSSNCVCSAVVLRWSAKESLGKIISATSNGQPEDRFSVRVRIYRMRRD